MKNMKFWRTALVATLVLTVMLSVTGGTIAWFTDSVTSANNVVASGNLEVAMSWKNRTEADTEYKDAATGAIFDYALWEPGYTDVKYVKIENAGNLAFKYQLNIKPTMQVAAGEVNLADVIEVYFGTGDAPTSTADLHDNGTLAGTISELALDTDGAAYGVLLPAGATKNDDFEEVGSVTRWIALHMKEEAGNEYQNKSVGEGFALTLLATQYTYEKDSFDNQYDKDATYDNSIWNGAPGNPEDVPEADVDNVITISTASELAAFAAAVNEGTSYSGMTVKLAADIDLNNQPWTPIGAADNRNYFQGTFDGQDHNISGLYVDKSTDAYENSTAGFFGWIDAASATIKNVNFDGANVKGSHWVGVVAGYMTGDIINCHVTNATVTGYNVNDDANGDKVGGIVGYVNDGSGELDSNSVKNSTISGYRDVAGLAGAVATTNTVTQNQVKNVTVKYMIDKDTIGAAEIVSPRTGFVVDSTNTAENVKVLKYVDDGLYKDTAGNFYVYNANGLMAFRDSVDFWGTDALAGKTINLMDNIDATDKTWETAVIASGSANRNGFTFNGNGYTISNLTIEKNSEKDAPGTGLFAMNSGNITPTTFKDVTFDNVTVDGGWHTGVLWGQVYGKIMVENVQVINSSITGVCNVGGLIGRNGDDGASEITFKNCAVKNTKVTSTGGGDNAGASAFLGMALKVGVNGVSVNLKFEGTNVAEGNTLTTADGQQGGGIYTTSAWDTDSWDTPVVVNDFTNHNNQ